MRYVVVGNVAGRLRIETSGEILHDEMLLFLRLRCLKEVKEVKEMETRRRR